LGLKCRCCSDAGFALITDIPVETAETKNTGTATTALEMGGFEMTNGVARWQHVLPGSAIAEGKKEATDESGTRFGKERKRSHG